MKRICLVMLTLLGFGCQKNKNNSINFVCPDAPVSQLKIEDVKKVNPTEQLINESGKINQNTTLAYSFFGEANQELVYKASQDICLWLFTPDNHILVSNPTKLPRDGQYILQISPRQGTQSFNLELSLNYPIDLSQSQTTISPEQSIRNYYKNINDRNYDESWQSLSLDFRNPSGSSSDNKIHYKDYQNWWDKVENVQLNEIRILEKNEKNAILKVDLKYEMKTGNIVQDQKPFFHLIWDEDNSHWLIAKKTSSR